MGLWIVAAWAAATIGVAWATPWSAGERMGVIGLVAALAGEALARVVFLRGRRAARSLRMQRDGAIEVERASGERVAGQLRAGSFVAPWLVIVRWRAHGSRWDSSLLLLPDMAESNALRRLRVLLRWA